MPRLLKRTADGARFIQSEDGSVRPVTDADMGLLGEVHVSQEMGITLGERFKLKNFASNPGAAKSWLRTAGYYVADLDNQGGFNFAVQKRQFDENGQVKSADPTAWKVVDPKGFSSPKEFFYDMLDLTTDTVEGILVGMAATAAATATAPSGPGALAAGAAAGGGAGTALAGIRQLAGAAMGIPENIDPVQVALIGGLSAAAPIAAAGLTKAGKAFARVALQNTKGAARLPAAFGSRLAGIADAEGQDAAVTFMKGTKFNLPGNELNTPLQLVGKMQGHLDTIARSPFIELDIADKLLARHSGKLVDIGPAVRQITDIKLDRVLAGEALETASSYLDDLGSKMGINFRMTGPKGAIKVNPETANFFTKSLQDEAVGLGGFTGKLLKVTDKVPRQFTKAITEASRTSRLALEKTMDKAVGTFSYPNSIGEIVTQLPIDKAGTLRPVTFSNLRLRVSEMVQVKNRMTELFGRGAKDSAETSLNTLFNASKEGRRGVLADFDSLYHTDYAGLSIKSFAEAAGDTFAARQFQKGAGAGFGEIPLFGQFTATGQFLGPALGASIGGKIGGGEGASTGALLGFGLASPRLLVGVARNVARTRPLTKPLRMTLDRLRTVANRPNASFGERATATMLLRETGKQILPDDRPVIREDER